MAMRDLTRNDIDEWRRMPYQLGSASTRDGKRKSFHMNADGWCYIHLNGVLISTWSNDVEAALEDYNRR